MSLGDCDCEDLGIPCAAEPGPCPECEPCVPTPGAPLIAICTTVPDVIRCGWPADRCPPHTVAVEPVTQPPVSPFASRVQIVPGVPIPADPGTWDADQWTARVTIERCWAQPSEQGTFTQLARQARLEVVARLMEDYQILRHLLVAGRCGTCGTNSATIERVERVASTTTLGWAFTVRL